MLFLLGRKVFVRNFHRFSLLFEVAGVFEWCRSLEVGFERTLHVWELALHAGVPVVLDGVVGSAFQNFGDLGPLVIDNSVHEEQNPLFLFAPADLLDHGVQVVVPALTALLTNAVW